MIIHVESRKQSETGCNKNMKEGIVFGVGSTVPMDDSVTTVINSDELEDDLKLIFQIMIQDDIIYNQGNVVLSLKLKNKF